jgi:hypothetical protein
MAALTGKRDIKEPASVLAISKMPMMRQASVKAGMLVMGSGDLKRNTHTDCATDDKKTRPKPRLKILTNDSMASGKTQLSLNPTQYKLYLFRPSLCVGQKAQIKFQKSKNPADCSAGFLQDSFD